MFRGAAIGTIVCAMLVTFGAQAFGAEPAKPPTVASQEMPKKEAMAAAKTEAGPVKELACPPECGFAVRGRDVKEITAVMKKHAKTAHKMDVTDAQCKAMMKDAAAK